LASIDTIASIGAARGQRGAFHYFDLETGDRLDPVGQPV
jgi:hypothetical protein